MERNDPTKLFSNFHMHTVRTVVCACMHARAHTHTIVIIISEIFKKNAETLYMDKKTIKSNK